MVINVKFTLLKSDAQAPTSIRLHFYYGKGKKFKYGTGKTILPQLWDSETQRPTTKKDILKKYVAGNTILQTQMKNIHTRLDNLTNEVGKVFNYLELQKIEPTNAIIREHLDQEFKGVKKPVKVKETLKDYIDRYIEEIKTGKRLTDKGMQYSKGTIKNYTGFLVQFEEYQKVNFKKLDFDDITMDFYDDFVFFFNEKNYSPNTIGRHLKQLKAIMRAAAEEKLHSNMEFTRKKFKTITEETDAIYLSEDELRKIYELDLTDTPTLELARDVFLIGCWTAQRFSDYSRIKKENLANTVKGNQVLELIQKKTGTKVVIPIRPDLETILKKYDYTVPKTYEQKVNSRIKEVGKLAGIDSIELFEQTKGGLKIKKRVAKYELIKTHTARRSGCTNMYLAGIAPLTITKISGHSDVKRLLTYIKVTKEETADILSGHQYFNRSPLKVAK